MMEGIIAFIANKCMGFSAQDMLAVILFLIF
jgi:hypothetical protein